MMKYTEQEFAKKDAHCSEQIKRLKEMVELAESESNLTVDGVPEPVSTQWREVAEIALDLANNADWFDRYYYYNDEIKYDDADLNDSSITPLHDYK